MRAAIFATVFMVTGVCFGESAARANPGADAVAFGRCVVSTDREGALRLFSTLPPSDAAVDLSSHAACAARSTGTASAMAVRGGIAEALYKRDFGEAMMEPRRAPERLAQLNLLEGPGDAVERFRLGLCVARSAPDAVDRLLAMPPGSTRERNAIGRLAPEFAPCQPYGLTVTLRRGNIRALLAQSAYVVHTRYWQMPDSASRAN